MVPENLFNIALVSGASRGLGQVMTIGLAQAGVDCLTGRLVRNSCFLASSASDYVNGQILVVDGGWLVR